MSACRPSTFQSRIALPLALWTLLYLPASATGITVGGGCTLVDAIIAANTDAPAGGCPAGSGEDVLVLAEDVTLTDPYGGSGSLNGTPGITSKITIEGHGHSVTRASVAEFRIFEVYPTGELTLENTTISNGGGPGFSTQGGAVFNWGTMSLYHSTVSGSSAFEGGGIMNVGVLDVIDSSVSDNTAIEGAGISNWWLLTLTGSTVSGNSATWSGGGLHTEGTITVTNSTFSGNSAVGTYSGADIETWGYFTSLTLTSSTLSSNTGGRAAISIFYSDTAYLKDSVFGGGTALNCFVHAGGSIVDQGGNLADDTSCGTIPSDLTGLDPDLADNGGPTLTHALLAGSSALNAAGDCGLATDQRGAARIPPCDCGAYEELGSEILEIEDQTIAGTEILQAGNTALLGPDLVIESTGQLTVTAGYLVTIKNHFRAEDGSELAIEIDPSLLP